MWPFFLVRFVVVAAAVATAKKREHRHRFSVVVDAGSTGCRVYAYEVTSDGDVKTERGPKVTPGLSELLSSSFEELAAYLKPLVDFATTAVPEAEWPRTPLKVLATAGMRLLRDDDAERLYQRVYAAVKRKGSFHVTRAEVRTISGEDEAYYAALAVNYAVGVADASKRRVAPLAGALDLGGASTQIAVPVASRPVEDDVVVVASDFQVRSYLGFGSMVFSRRFFADPRRAAACTHTAYDGQRFDQCAAAIAAFLGVDTCASSSSSQRRRRRTTTTTTTTTTRQNFDERRRRPRATSAFAAAALQRLENGTSTRPPCEPSFLGDGVGGAGGVTVAAANAKPFGKDRIPSEVRFVATSLYYYAWRSMSQMLRAATVTPPFGVSSTTTTPAAQEGFPRNASVVDDVEAEWPRPSLEHVRRAARVVCSASATDVERLASSDEKLWDAFVGDEARRSAEFPRRCFDLSYVDVLLSDVFGLADRQVTAAVAVGDVDLDWTLGVVLDDADSQASSSSSSLEQQRQRRRQRRRQREREHPPTFWGSLFSSSQDDDDDQSPRKRANDREKPVMLPTDTAAFVFGFASLLACAGLFAVAVCLRLRLFPSATKKCDDPAGCRACGACPVVGANGTTSLGGGEKINDRERPVRSSPPTQLQLWGGNKSRSRSWPKNLQQTAQQPSTSLMST